MGRFTAIELKDGVNEDAAEGNPRSFGSSIQWQTNSSADKINGLRLLVLFCFCFVIFPLQVYNVCGGC